MKKIFSLVVALLTLVSCSEDFLNLTPQYYPNDATFFKTQEQFTQAVNGAYSALRGVSARQGYVPTIHITPAIKQTVVYTSCIVKISRILL